MTILLLQYLFSQKTHNIAKSAHPACVPRHCLMNISDNWKWKWLEVLSGNMKIDSDKMILSKWFLWLTWLSILNLFQTVHLSSSQEPSQCLFLYGFWIIQKCIFKKSHKGGSEFETPYLHKHKNLTGHKNSKMGRPAKDKTWCCFWNMKSFFFFYKIFFLTLQFQSPMSIT